MFLTNGLTGDFEFYLQFADTESDTEEPIWFFNLYYLPKNVIKDCSKSSMIRAIPAITDGRESPLYCFTDLKFLVDLFKDTSESYKEDLTNLSLFMNPIGAENVAGAICLASEQSYEDFILKLEECCKNYG